MKLFIHGVPDTPHLWEPLVAALGLQEQDYLARWKRQAAMSILSAMTGARC